MICPACGAANEDGVPFCESCKADLEMPAAAPADSPPPDLNASTDTPSEEEPIALEPIDLEPVSEQLPPPLPEPPTEEAPGSSILESTGDHPAAPPASEDFPTSELPGDPPQTPATMPDAATGSPKLVVVRGQRIDAVYPIYPGKNYMGRTDDKPVDIDLEDQEAQDRIWSSRQHAVITFEDGKLTLEDLSSLNGTFVNRTRVHPGQLKELQANDVIQIGTVHMKVVL